MLEEIRIKCNGSLIKKYSFYYEREDHDIYSLLNEVVESNASGGTLNSTVFTWGEKFNPSEGLVFNELNQTVFWDEQGGAVSFVPQNLITKQVKWGFSSPVVMLPSSSQTFQESSFNIGTIGSSHLLGGSNWNLS